MLFNEGTDIKPTNISNDNNVTCYLMKVLILNQPISAMIIMLHMLFNEGTDIKPINISNDNNLHVIYTDIKPTNISNDNNVTYVI